MIDSTDAERLSTTKEELFKMLAHEQLQNAKILIYANKQDITGCLTPSEVANGLSLHSVKDHEYHIQGCCGLTGEGLFEGLDWLTSAVKNLNPIKETDSKQEKSHHQPNK